MKDLVRVYWRALMIPLGEESLLSVALMLTSVFVAFIQVAEPVLFGRVIDSLSHQDTALHLLVLWGGLGVINILSSVFLAVASDRLAHRRRLDALDEVFERVISLPVSYHTEKGSGRVVRAILAGTDQLFNLWLSFFREHLSSLIGIFFLVPLAMSMDPRMASMLFVLAAVYVIANYRIVKRTHRLQGLVEDHQQDLFARIGDVVGNVTVVQSYSRLRQEIADVQEITGQLLSAQYPILTWWGVLAVITRISATLTMVALLSLGSWLVAQGKITAGAVVSFVAFSGLLIGKLEQISNFLSQTISRGPILQNYFHLIDENSTTQETAHARPLGAVSGEVAFVDVSYCHPGSPFGVFNLDFVAKPGQTVALVGASGAGKTTALALIQRLFDPDEGKITIDGEDVRQFTLSSLRHTIATVFQEAGLFNRSILENIRVGRPEATEAEVIDAAKRAEAHEFISAKPNGYQFVIGERGSALSGGERQRIAIARAILKNAPVLIFDEATSALDNRTEKKIQAAINNLRAQQKTTFVIAHRLSTVINADQILMFDKGRIIESGTFEELRARGGQFAGLVEAGELNLPAAQA